MSRFQLKCRYCLKEDIKSNLFLPCDCILIHRTCLATDCNRRFFFYKFWSLKTSCRYRCGHCKQNVIGLFIKKFGPRFSYKIKAWAFSLIVLLVIFSIATYISSLVEIIRGDPRQRLSDPLLSKLYALLIWTTVFISPLLYGLILFLLAIDYVPGIRFNMFQLYWEETAVDESETIVVIVESLNLPEEPADQEVIHVCSAA